MGDLAAAINHKSGDRDARFSLAMIESSFAILHRQVFQSSVNPPEPEGVRSEQG
jgi:hypothetical protein